ncbi:mucin-2-like [Branchiostoma floridae]|uniref:Mucin-2-like n=1 Tax=Branchiostoma floridae TaxID=7739 RepID=A0A9J7L6P3_BRAFL|nr:mucin-2-like [Branchiostoma floridae]
MGLTKAQLWTCLALLCLGGTDAAGRQQRSAMMIHCIIWAPYVNTNYPTPVEGGDFENITNVIAASTCKNPVDIKCQVAGFAMPYQDVVNMGMQNNINCNLWTGLTCSDNEQPSGSCYDYEVSAGLLEHDGATLW